MAALCATACTDTNPAGPGEQFGPEPAVELVDEAPMDCGAFFDWDESSCDEGGEFIYVEVLEHVTRPRTESACGRPYRGMDGTEYMSTHSIPSTTRDASTNELITYSSVYEDGYIYVVCDGDRIDSAVYYTRPQVVEYGTPGAFGPDDGACVLLCDHTRCMKSERGRDFPLCGTETD